MKCQFNTFFDSCRDAECGALAITDPAIKVAFGSECPDDAIALIINGLLCVIDTRIARIEIQGLRTKAMRNLSEMY